MRHLRTPLALLWLSIGCGPHGDTGASSFTIEADGTTRTFDGLDLNCDALGGIDASAQGTGPTVRVQFPPNAADGAVFSVTDEGVEVDVDDGAAWIVTDGTVFIDENQNFDADLVVRVRLEGIMDDVGRRLEGTLDCIETLSGTALAACAGGGGGGDGDGDSD